MNRTHKIVLIVEDNPAQALALKNLLTEEGLRVRWAPDGKAGLLKAQQLMPDVIILDIKMPGIDGFETCRRLKENVKTADIPVVMLSVQDDAATVAHGIDLGAVD